MSRRHRITVQVGPGDLRVLDELETQLKKEFGSVNRSQMIRAAIRQGVESIREDPAKYRTEEPLPPQLADRRERGTEEA